MTEIAMRTGDMIPAGTDSARNGDDRIGRLWEKLSRADWSSSAAAYMTAMDARRIIEMTGMTLAAFAAECSARRISGFGSQASVSRRLRWAILHDELWTAGTLPQGVFLAESVTRPLFDGKLSQVDRLRLLAELFGPHMTDDQKRDLADRLTQALMREHLARAGQGGPGYRAPKRYVPERVIAKLLAQGVTADEISKIARALEDSARNAASRGTP